MKKPSSKIKAVLVQGYPIGNILINNIIKTIMSEVHKFVNMNYNVL